MTLLIRNAEIVDGVREFPSKADIFVAGEKISAIGSFPNKAADVVIDAQGASVSPGFVDVNTSSDHYLTLLEHPEQEDFLRQGITTIFGGMCGASLAPLLYGTLDSMGKWGNPREVNVNWHTMAELLETFDRRRLALNFGTLAGHTTVEYDIADDSARDLTKNELDVLTETLKRALAEGGFGISTGLGYMHGRKTSYAELRLLADIAKDYNGVYATHLRNATAGVLDSVEETIKLAKETGTRTLISHFTPIIGNEKEYRAALAAINETPETVDLHFDIYPSATSLVPLYTLLPGWAQTAGEDIMLANIKDEWMQPRIKTEMQQFDPDEFVLAEAPGSDFLVGKTLREIMHIYDTQDPKEGLLRLMIALRLRGIVLHKNLSSDLIKEAIFSKRSFVGSNAPSFANEHRLRRLKSERTTSTFPMFLLLAKEHGIAPRDAIRKITSAPAAMFGLSGRGSIKEGNFADLVCYRDETVQCTIVNGAVAWKDGAFQQNFAGKALRHASGK